ncbi:hypothetical protein GUJ93_ZPchr0012g19339 [Zizania palustris]|uniref:Ubiquitin-like domain-containing protein n=1 Tax=Zizania palustris TaxID=103762 RepID=A0A8J5WQQ3_ZIZPA|nr:hypothetical protein GUJ93_ZPchr0012g19339 [Zizania palustris]
MEVTIETMAGKVFTVEVWYMSSVTAMKMAVETKEGFPVESQRFFFKDRELHDDMDVAQCSVVDGSRVWLVLPENGYFRSGRAANVRLRVVVTGAAPQLGRLGVTLHVSSACTIRRLKELVEERTYGALPAARLALLVGNNVEMRDDKAVAVYALPWPERVDVTAVLAAAS